MLKSKECIAMLLAGGQGSRLHVLTKNVAKPAVPFGGKYRIIDFPLSNCINSGIDTVGVLTQYQPLELNTYIGNGQPWDLDRSNGGVAILPPYMTSTSGAWYKGTANAIYQNINFIRNFNPKYVLVLSGDHVYKMNYDWMLREHKKTQADCTIAVIDVPIEEASRFGIMNLRDDNSVYEFEEKPENPKSTKASMGVYIFTWEVLERYLIEDENNPESQNDFGKNIIPKMLGDGRKLFAYEYKGYWKDVGTIDSLWESNMDAITPGSGLVLHDKGWRIYARNPVKPAQFISTDAVVKNSMIAEGCYTCGTVDHSIIFYDVKIGKGAVVNNSIIMPGSVIEDGAVVEYSIIAENVTVRAGAKIGAAPAMGESKKITVVGNSLTVGENARVEPGTIVEDDVPDAEVAL
ncbi:MAG: glucose-1-phosphate adenylyltransferase [Oscillospiraceae bacterium]|nr:glucose-1-phosphate adenylyltransferase [Oscillospiraceae bacterium]MBQ2742007.1 glucose-1-phosphate adenylyltransferase [Oscillospiraceae bacterium]